ncbi:Rne/Rng family ribonuclease [Ignatzschineria rhizosphaerae]|uniref:Ribonuclease E n=1 Tax=Ignatzschineria rhizosphaerae TaxID=2923279 RepID=A0ABY3WZG1_9GAMM|nr:Rne/Rng family ribonuclease [Ignatzschineria rhizosphaerae]UNM96012.1 Rne/Rng family ribonuclease [Ignatzschineria rhizosphaerae]
MKRMLINATQQEEMRVALVDGQHLYDLDIENVATKQKKANIYKGKITRIEPSLEACFVDYGSERHGFLPFKEISREYFKNSGDHSIAIKDQLEEGLELIIQVEREERGNKGAALTTFISLAGRYLVLMPNNPRAGGVSRRISGKNRAEIRDAMAALTVPDEMGLIVRTAGMGRTAEELQWDLDYLIMLWEAIIDAGKRPAPLLIFQESNIIIRALRDYYRSDIGEILIDDETVFKEAEVFINNIMPQIGDKIKLYDDQIPLFTRFQVESQIQTAYERNVRLPSGGALVFDHTEALVSIDINSGRSTKGADIEDTALNTNIEAAEEIARQLKLRDLGGLIVIDFIDMLDSKNQRKVEGALHDALASDRARIQVGQISRFGLLEMSRQRLRPSLDETSHIVCPRCEGQGTIRDTKSLALGILRIIEEECLKERTSELVIQVPVNVAVYLLNEKRSDVEDIETRLKVRVIVIPDSNFETPHFHITRYRVNDEETGLDSENHIIKEELTIDDIRNQAVIQNKKLMEKPAVSGISPIAPPPKTAEKVEVKEAEKSEGIFTSLITFFKNLLGNNASDNNEKQKDKKRSSKDQRRNNNRSKNSQNQRPRNNNQRQRNQRHNHPSRNTIETIEREVDSNAAFNQENGSQTEQQGQQRHNRRNNNQNRDERNNQNQRRNQRQNANQAQENGQDSQAREQKGKEVTQERETRDNHQRDNQRQNDRRNRGNDRENQGENQDQREQQRERNRNARKSQDNNPAVEEETSKNSEVIETEERAPRQQRNRRNNRKVETPVVTNDKGEEIIEVKVGEETRERTIRKGRPRVAKAEVTEDQAVNNAQTSDSDANTSESQVETPKNEKPRTPREPRKPRERRPRVAAETNENTQTTTEKKVVSDHTETEKNIPTKEAVNVSGSEEPTAQAKEAPTKAETAKSEAISEANSETTTELDINAMIPDSVIQPAEKEALAEVEEISDKAVEVKENTEINIAHEAVEAKVTEAKSNDTKSVQTESIHVETHESKSVKVDTTSEQVTAPQATAKGEAIVENTENVTKAAPENAEEPVKNSTPQQ